MLHPCKTREPQVLKDILTGAAAGDRRTIRDNTATDITPVRRFTAAVADGDLYRIVEPAVTINLPPSAYVCDGLGGTYNVNQFRAGDSGIPPALVFANFKFVQNSNSLTNNYFTRSHVQLFGCELTVDGGALPFRTVGESIFSGGDSNVFSESEIGATLSGLTKSSWAGWGSYVHSAGGFQPRDSFTGYAVCVGGNLSVPDRCRVFLVSGAVEHSHATTAAVDINSGNEQSIQIGTFSALVGITPLITNLAAGPALRIDVGSLAGGGKSFALIQKATLTSTGGRVVQVRGGGQVNIDDATTGTGTIGIDASYGARVFIHGACGILGNAGNDLTVDAGSTFGTAASLAAAGDARFNATNGSAIVRQG